MAYPVLFTQAQLQMAVGGADKLLQLVDKNQTGQLSDSSCQAYIVEIQQAASSEVLSIAKVAVDPNDATVLNDSLVVQTALVIGVYWAWHKSTGGVAVPEEVKAARQEAIATLERLAEGRRALGALVDPASNAGAKMVTIDKAGTRITRGNSGGFC